MRWFVQESRKALCWHDYRVRAFDARMIDDSGNQYELEMCAHCYAIRRGALVKRGRS